MNDEVGLLQVAIERKDWETAALCLALGVVRTAARYPEDVIEEMINELVGELTEPIRGRRGRWRRRSHRGR